MIGTPLIDIDAVIHRGFTVTHAPDVLTETTADLTFDLLMTTARRLVGTDH